jgi:hypothetical protein
MTPYWEMTALMLEEGKRRADWRERYPPLVLLLIFFQILRGDEEWVTNQHFLHPQRFVKD